MSCSCNLYTNYIQPLYQPVYNLVTKVKNTLAIQNRIQRVSQELVKSLILYTHNLILYTHKTGVTQTKPFVTPANHKKEGRLLIKGKHIFDGFTDTLQVYLFYMEYQGSMYCRLLQFFVSLYCSLQLRTCAVLQNTLLYSTEHYCAGYYRAGHYSAGSPQSSTRHYSGV